MNEPDLLELELAALRPVAPSQTLKERIAVRLDADSSGETRRATSRSWRRTAIGATLLAASLAAVILWWGNDRTSDADAQVGTTELDLHTAFDESSPSLWSYRSAVLQSSGSLNDVLNKFDAHTIEHKSGGAPGLFATRFHSDIDSIWREL